MDKASPKVAVDYVRSAVVVTLNYEKILDEVDIKSIEKSVLPVIDDNDNIKLVLDFSKVQFLSSAMLGLLIRIKKIVEDKGGQLRLAGINPKIMGVFKITRLDKVFTIVEDSVAATESF